MKKLGRNKVILLILTCACCVDPFSTSLPLSRTLVVDGLITDQAGPQTVTLSYASDLGTGATTREFASGGLVTIVDNDGLQTALREVSPGVYQTDSSFMAQAGKSYSLTINITGETYQSDTESLLAAANPDSLYFFLNERSPVVQFEVYANANKAESNGQMRWRSSFIYQVMTQPSLHVGEGGGIAPLPCSGANTIPATACTCCNCWVSGQISGIQISDESDFISDRFDGNLVCTVPIGGKEFEFKYYLKVELLSLSTSAYNFWKLVRNQQTGAGSLFQPVSARVQGNIHALSNADETVIGLFQVSSIRSKSVFISRNEIPVNQQPVIPLETDDCRAQGSNIRPPFW